MSATRQAWPEPSAGWSFDDVAAGRDRADAGTFRLGEPFYASTKWRPDDPPYPRTFLLDGWLATRSAALLAGEGGTGKSLLGQMLCSCVALGLPFLGYATQGANAVYLTCEDDENELHHRQLAINAALGVTMEHYGERLTLWSLKGRDAPDFARIGEDGRTIAGELYDQIASELEDTRLLVLDNAAHLFPGNEIVRRDVAGFCGLLDRLSMRLNGTVVLLAHTAKVTGSQYSGSTGWDAHVRQRLFLSHDNESGDPDLRKLERSKSNYARRGETVRFRWYEGAFVTDRDLPADSLAELALVAQQCSDNARFLRCLDERTRQQRAVSESVSSTYAPKVFASMPEAKGATQARLAAAMDRLFRLGSIERGLLPWTQHRRPVEGLRLTVTDGRVDAALTGCADATDLSAQTATDTHPILHIEGGASQGPPPSVSDWASASPDDVDTVGLGE